jgi:transposase
MGEPDRRIARDLGVSRNTVARYRGWAQQRGLLAGELPPLEAMAKLLQPVEAQPRPPHEQSQVEPFREQVQALRQRGVEGQAIWQILVDQHGFTGSYSAIKRFLRRLTPPGDGATIRLEVAPGDEAQVDFGFAGQFFDPETNRVRRAWVFVMTLSFSRHQYAELVFDQTIET